NGNKGKTNVQLAESRDLVHWAMVKDDKGARDAMPELPAWAKKGFTWAPEVLKTDTGYVLYFTARDKKSGMQCVGAAAATDPAGPFTSTAASPLVRSEEHTSELQSRGHLVCRLLLEKKNKQ